MAHPTPPDPPPDPRPGPPSYDASAQALADALPEGVVVADGAGTVLLVNAVARRMLGLDGPPVGHPLTDVLRLQDQHGATWVDHNCPLGGIGTRTGVPEQPWFVPGGEEVLTTARLVRPSPCDPVVQVVVSLRWGRGRARLDRERSDLVATVAHELRSPLTGVKGFVQALLNRWDRLNDDQKLLMLTTVNADADRLSRLIAELLDVARIDTGRLSIFARPVDAATIVGRVVDSVQAGTARTVRLAVADDLPEVQADPDKLTQVVTNLVENGVRHGGGAVDVRLEPSPPGDDGTVRWVQLVVDDEGDGIPVEIRRRVFTKFWTHGVRGGSGLGMYIVNGLVRAHGGSVRIGDSPTGGARIEVLWPTVQPDEGWGEHAPGAS